MKSIILWDVTLCSAVKLHRRSFKTSVDLYQTTLRYISEYIPILSHRCENLKYNLHNHFICFVY
jgi:hypothetical protein